jgi:hypothetical protein
VIDQLVDLRQLVGLTHMTVTRARIRRGAIDFAGATDAQSRSADVERTAAAQARAIAANSREPEPWREAREGHAAATWRARLRQRAPANGASISRGSNNRTWPTQRSPEESVAQRFRRRRDGVVAKAGRQGARIVIAKQGHQRRFVSGTV